MRGDGGVGRSGMLRTYGLLVCVLWAGGVLRGGNVGVEFLRMGGGARSEGMGGAYSAVSKDGSAVYHNPGGLAEQGGWNAGLTHGTHIAESFYDFGYYGRGSYGFGVQYFGAGKVDNLDEGGSLIGEVSPSDVAVLVGRGWKVGGTSVGVVGKYVRSKLVESGSGYGVDVGMRTREFGPKKLVGAVVVKNMGVGVKYGEGERTDLPMEVRVGGAMAVANGWLVSGEGVSPRGGERYVSVGGEYGRDMGKMVRVALRGGYRMERAGDGNGLSVGAGFWVNGWNVDYALISLGDFDVSHRVAINFAMGGR